MNWLGLLGVILVAAKILGYTSLSWALVTAPFWVPFLIVMLIGLFSLVLFLVAAASALSK